MNAFEGCDQTQISSRQGTFFYIPDEPPRTWFTLEPGGEYTFVVPAPRTTRIRVAFVGTEQGNYACRSFTIAELAELGTLATDENGIASFDAPVTLATATVRFTRPDEAWRVAIGALDPIDTVLGVFQRLRGLAYLPGDLCYDNRDVAPNLPVMRRALRAFLFHATGQQIADPNAGLSDKGELSEDVAQKLLGAYGC